MVLLWNKLLNALNNRKPFANFKNIVETSSFRQAWFDYKQGHLKKWFGKSLNKSLNILRKISRNIAKKLTASITTMAPKSTPIRYLFQACVSFAGNTKLTTGTRTCFAWWTATISAMKLILNAGLSKRSTNVIVLYKTLPGAGLCRWKRVGWNGNVINRITDPKLSGGDCKSQLATFDRTFLAFTAYLRKLWTFSIALNIYKIPYSRFQS